MHVKKMKPITVDPEKMFPQVEKMLYAQAWKFANSYPIPFEEAKAEAYFAFVRACHDYKKGRGSKFSSWCYYWVWTALKDLITKRSKDPHVFIDLMAEDEMERRQAEEMIGVESSVSGEFREFVEDIVTGLSDDAKELLHLILDAPAELLGGDRPTPKQLLVRVKKFLLASGKEKCKLDLAHLELERCFREAWAA